MSTRTVKKAGKEERRRDEDPRVLSEGSDLWTDPMMKLTVIGVPTLLVLGNLS